MSFKNTMMINIEQDDSNLANPKLERAFLKLGNKVEKGAALCKMTQYPAKK